MCVNLYWNDVVLSCIYKNTKFVGVVLKILANKTLLVLLSYWNLNHVWFQGRLYSYNVLQIPTYKYCSFLINELYLNFNLPYLKLIIKTCSQFGNIYTLHVFHVLFFFDIFNIHTIYRRNIKHNNSTFCTNGWNHYIMTSILVNIV